MKQSLVSYKLCFPNNINEFIITDNTVRARDALSASKKLFRNHKTLINIYVLNTSNNEIYQFETKSFFTKKKEHLLKRKN